MSKSKRTIRSIILAVLVLLVVIPCGILIHGVLKNQTNVSVELYYMMSDDKMKVVNKVLPLEETEGLVTSVLRELQTESQPEGAEVAIPQNLVIVVEDITDGVVTLNITEDYYEMTAFQEVICRSSIVWSLTSIEGVNHVVILVDGRPLASKTGTEYDLLNRENVLIDSVVPATTTKHAVLQLYFANEDATDLVVEERVVEVDANQAREKTILEQLIVGPQEEGHYSTVPTETKIKDVTVTTDGICYVNLSQEFVTKHNGGSTGELLTVYSIVNSLCEQQAVDKVQFLVEGEKLVVYKGHVDFSTPFEAIDSLAAVE